MGRHLLPPDYPFEMFLLLFVTSHLLLQSYNLNHWNLHTYNVPHIAFTAVLFTMRVAWKSVYPSWAGNERITLGLAFRVALWLVPTLSLIKSSFELFSQHDIQTFMFLLYPYCLYFSLFGGSFGHSMRWRHHKLRGIALNEPLKPAAVILDFRHCVKQIIYGSIEAGYYAGVLPIRFLLNRHAVFDKRTCLLVVIFVFLNTLTLLMANMLSTCSKTLYEQARVLGCWQLLSNQKTAQGATKWTAHQEWDKGQKVWHNKKAYIGEGQLNTAEPGDFTAWIFYRTFRNPRHITSRIVYFQVAVCGSQILCLLMARRREAVIGWATMIGFSYAVLYFTLTVRRKIVTRNTAVT